ncbi:MAG: ribosomal protein S18-alanine N-acetyltransferase [Rhodospirillales bacterium]
MAANGARWTLVDAGGDDAGNLAIVHATAFADAWDAETFAAFLAQPGGFALIAGDDETTAGFVLARAVAGESEVLTLAVRPDCRRAGCATRLLAGAIARAATLGAQRMVLEVAVDNAAALRLYRRAGFNPVGRRRGYYCRDDGDAGDALVLALGW